MSQHFQFIEIFQQNFQKSKCWEQIYTVYYIYRYIYICFIYVYERDIQKDIEKETKIQRDTERGKEIIYLKINFRGNVQQPEINRYICSSGKTFKCLVNSYVLRIVGEVHEGYKV